MAKDKKYKLQVNQQASVNDKNQSQKYSKTFRGRKLPYGLKRNKKLC